MEGCFGYVFFGIFALAGLGVISITLLWPAWNVFQALSWQPTSCTVTSSEVEEFVDSEGSDTYRIAIHYSYAVGSQIFHGSRYNFSFGASSGYESKQRIVDQYPVGAEVICFVDGDDPARSVINRDAGTYMLWSLIGLPFLLVGLGGLVYMRLRPDASRRAKTISSRTGGTRPGPPPPSPASGFATASTGSPSKDPAAAVPASLLGSQTYGGEITESRVTGLADPLVFEPDANGRLVLESSSNAKAMAIALFIAVLVVVPLLGHILPEFWTPPSEAGPFEWLMNSFTIPFILAALGLIGGVFYFLLATTNPKPKMILDRARPVLGDVCRLMWTFDGDPGKFQRLTVTLQGREMAIYRRGTDSTTHHHVFFEEQLFAADRVESRGSLTFQIPHRGLPSFVAGHNEVEWQLVVHGDIPRWPDVKEVMKFPVFPPGVDPTELNPMEPNLMESDPMETRP